MSYITNFKPQILEISKTDFFVFQKLKKNNHILCRNFFLFFLYLKYCYSNKIVKNVSIFVKPFYKNTFTILRAPYRYKLGRYQYTLSRYFVLCSFQFTTQSLVFENMINIINFLKLCKNFYPWFESNLCYQHSVKIRFTGVLNSFFNFKNYKKKN